MALEVIDDQAAIVEAFKRALGDKMPEAIMVCCQYIEGASDRRVDYHGLDVAIEQAKTGRPIIIYGFDSPDSQRLAQDHRFVGLIGMANVAYVQVPQTRITDIVQLYQDMKSGRKTDDPTAIQMMRLEQIDRVVASFRHDWNYAQQDATRRQAWLDRARQVGFSGTDEEVIAVVLAWERKSSGLFAGQYFPGVFVDVYGTLLTVDDGLNEQVRDKALELAAGKPITIWTDSDLLVVNKKLRPFGLGWKLASKFDFKDSEVEIAIDDLPQTEFQQRFGIKVRQYYQV